MRIEVGSKSIDLSLGEALALSALITGWIPSFMNKLKGE